MRRLKLHHFILIAMVLGAGIGLTVNALAAGGTLEAETAAQVASIGSELGEIFLRLLQMIVVPLIVTSLITGVTGMGDLKKLGRLGGMTVGLYVLTSFFAIVTGIFMSNALRPGADSSLRIETGPTRLEQDLEAQRSVWEVLWTQLKEMIPKNPIAAMAEGDMLSVIFFSLLLGVFISVARANETSQAAGRGGPADGPGHFLERLFSSLFEVIMKMTLFAIAFAPIGVFGFMLAAAAGSGLEAFEDLGLYALTVFLGLLIHGAVTLPILVRLIARRSPWGHAKAMAPALLTAFSTASSNGTLPLTITCVEERAGISNRISSFVLPLGATINMDGTALYEAAAVLFIAQVYGVDLTLAQQAIVAFTALLASVGAAGIPHAGTVMMVVVLTAVGLPTTAVGLILAVDRVLDMCRTTINVWSDSCCAAMVARLDGEKPEPPAPHAGEGKLESLIT